ncbi:hormogonium polysaccharide biosynthesis glycosyltransferase HpsE [Leptolyngbya sp. PCC 6406]|uniref:hormogonium polysaccharide biosynthesis glycosyltransferase HpsE n=1 Tax=Leptolyngbya sp. PCC 6406 TaxID=1173264 RepID=UPI0002AC5629|nr:hormogonium polysaccharide biosynthesis glycosyltransferase HpsE [Leptolyngbya sp. PCC 6406]
MDSSIRPASAFVTRSFRKASTSFNASGKSYSSTVDLRENITSDNLQGVAALDFTVAICTYNGAERLPDVLDCLVEQGPIEDCNWEVIVVDNNSTDATPQVVQTYQKKYPHLGLRYTSESRQGAGYARHTAIREAHSSLVGFLDDDNLPESNWIQASYYFAQEHPQAAVIGSRIHGDLETDPPAHFERIAAFLALTDRGNEPIPYRPQQKILPPGAGMVVRRDLWLRHVPDEPVLGGRDGKSMLTGEDIEAVLQIQQAGGEVWYNPAMRIAHKIPAKRLQRQYLLSLMRGIGLSRHRTRMLSLPAWKRPLMFWAYHLNDLRKVLIHLKRYGSDAWTDTVAASELTLYLFSLVSPYYLWQRSLCQKLAGRS